MTGPAGFPRRFDSYVLLKPLARGGMGQLYLALSGAPGLEKLCVIKQVIPDLVVPEGSSRFRDEALVALRLSHGNLVSVFDAGLHGEQVFLAMEHVDGKDLLFTWNRCAERRVPFPVDVAVYIIKEIARALAYAHAFENLELIHRDVSPANVMLSYTGEVKLTDFGLAMSILKIARTTPGIIYGKLSYLSPEQARRQPLDGRVDIYAAGILLWELLTGRQLFPVDAKPYDDSAVALERARNPTIVAPSTITGRVPPELDRIVLRALAPDVADRYPDAEALRADLAAFLADTAPLTDADRLAAFLRPLFADDAREERRERDRLTAGARALLSSGISSLDGGGDTTVAPVRGPSSRPGEDPRIDTTLGGRYLVRRLCGEGAMGRVYEGQHIDIGRRVAIKILHANFHHSADLVERFRREARAASKIGHPNIVDVTDSGTTSDGAFYFVMEYLDGTNLEELIVGTGPLPVERALLIGAQIARALEAAHAADVIHRDLKPANVMLVNRKDAEDFVKVLDFGISKDLDAGSGASLTNPDIAIGTPVYMAPEQAAGKPANALTDIYGVGGLLYEMLTGAPPCVGDDAIEVLHRKAEEDPRPIGELRPDLPREVQRMVMRALARAPSDRPSSMAALKEELLGCLAAVEGAPTPAKVGIASSITPRVSLRPPPLEARRGDRRRGSRIGRAVALGGLATLIGGVVGAVVFHRSPPPPSPMGAPPPPAAPQAEKVPAAAARRSVERESPPVTVRPAGAERRISLNAGSASTAAKLVARIEPPPAGKTITRLEPPALDREGILRRGQSAFDRGDYPEAVRRGREAIAAGAEVEGRLLVGDAYYRLARYRDALREYDAALSRDPDSASTRRRRDLAEQKTNAGP